MLDFKKEGDQDLIKTNEYTSALYLPKKGGYSEEMNDRMIVVGKDKENGGAILTVFDCKTDKFVKNPLIFKREDKYDSELGTDLFKINAVSMVTTPQYLIKNMVVATNRGTLKVMNLPETQKNDLH
jgi:hypothetical protein